MSLGHEFSPLPTRKVGLLFLPWLAANSHALNEGQSSSLREMPWKQASQEADFFMECLGRRLMVTEVGELFPFVVRIEEDGALSLRFNEVLGRNANFLIKGSDKWSFESLHLLKPSSVSVSRQTRYNGDEWEVSFILKETAQSQAMLGSAQQSDVSIKVVGRPRLLISEKVLYLELHTSGEDPFRQPSLVKDWNEFLTRYPDLNLLRNNDSVTLIKRDMGSMGVWESKLKSMGAWLGLWALYRSGIEWLIANIPPKTVVIPDKK